MFLIKHLLNMLKNNVDASIQMPNNMFKTLNLIIRFENDKPNVQQLSFLYSYLVLNAFFYKYSYYVDLENESYIQVNDIKQILGYTKNTRTINQYIKKDGLLDKHNLTETSKEYPIATIRDYTETIFNIPLYDFKYLKDFEEDIILNQYKKIIKNRNYEIKVPLFLFDYENDTGTLYNYDNTHKVKLSEFIHVIHKLKLDKTDFLLYMYFKSMCFGYKDNKTSIAQDTFVKHLNISTSTLYKHLDVLESNNLVIPIRKGWKYDESDEREINEYIFKEI